MLDSGDPLPLPAETLAMPTIRPLSQVPEARAVCIRWCDAEWGAAARYSITDWEAEFDRIEAHPVDEIFVALEGTVPVGMAWMLEREGPRRLSHLTPWLSSLIVAPEHRDRGVARALIAHVEAYAATGGDEVLFLLTETPSVYFLSGWEVRDTAPTRNGDVFVMQKALEGYSAEPAGRR